MDIIRNWDSGREEAIFELYLDEGRENLIYPAVLDFLIEIGNYVEMSELERLEIPTIRRH